MPKAKSANCSLRKVAEKIPAHLAAHRFAALQRSGQYSELRFIQRGKSFFDIVGFKWPDKSARRRLGVGSARKNPNQTGAATPNQVRFGMRGRTVVGWINRETPTRYEISYKVGAALKHVWRSKDKVVFVTTGRRGLVKANPNKATCPTTANPEAALKSAAELSRKFFGFDPRKVRRINLTWPKALMCLGSCVRLDYLSDKFDGKARVYFHEFDGPCNVYAAEKQQADGSGVLVIHGKFKIKPEGITG